MLKKKRSSGITVLAIFICAILFVQAVSLAQDKARKIDELLQLYFDYGQFNGTALVAQSGKVLFKKGYGLANMEWDLPNKPDTKFRLGSITKQFTSMLILQLVEESKIDLEGKLSDYLPYYRKDTGERVTIHHLLTHTSGIPSHTGLPNFFEEISRNPCPVEEFVKTYCSGDLEFEPGSKYTYNNSGYFLLGAIIEEVTGEVYENVLKAKILDPLGMKNTGYDHYEALIPHRASGYEKRAGGYANAPYLDMSLPYAAGGLYSTVEDLYIWDQALYTEKLLSKEYKELMFTPHVRAGGSHYAYGWIVGEKSFPKSKEKAKWVAHGGGINGFNTLIQRLVEDRHLVVLFNNTGGAPLGIMSDGILNILYDKPYGLPKRSIADVFLKTLREKGIEAAIEQYRDLKTNHPKDYIFQPRELNTVGYMVLRDMKNPEAAIDIFKLNVEMYPRYANGYDSLAEAYMENGDFEKAIKFFAKSLELNPKNTNAIGKLHEINEKLK
ncbi:MAG: serine hydrolase [Candidatus Aminicenantes bacterium]